jgi:hypothetical protein
MLMEQVSLTHWLVTARRTASSFTARCFWTRSANSRRNCRRSCCGCCRKGSSSEWAERELFRWIHG